MRVLAQLPSLTNAQLERLLWEFGIDRRTARHIVIFAPAAAARIWFKTSGLQVTFLSNTYWLEHVERPLAENPVFAACLADDERWSMTEIRAMATRSGAYKSIMLMHEERPSSTAFQAGSLRIVPPEYFDPGGDHEPHFLRWGPRRVMRLLQGWWLGR